MGSVSLRDAREEDCEQIVTLMQELAEEEEIDGVKVDSESLKRDGFGNNKRFHCFVAEDSEHAREGDQIVGILLYTWLPKILKQGTAMYIENLYVKEEFRRRGIGRLLMERAIRVCKENKYFRIQMTTTLHNQAAIRFYKQFGASNDSIEKGWQITNIIIK